MQFSGYKDFRKNAFGASLKLIGWATATYDRKKYLANLVICSINNKKCRILCTYFAVRALAATLNQNFIA
jgi:hypothetical protein